MTQLVRPQDPTIWQWQFRRSKINSLRCMMISRLTCRFDRNPAQNTYNEIQISLWPLPWRPLRYILWTKKHTSGLCFQHTNLLYSPSLVPTLPHVITTYVKGPWADIINLCGAETRIFRIFRENSVNIITANALDPCITRPSAFTYWI